MKVDQAHGHNGLRLRRNALELQSGLTAPRVLATMAISAWLLVGCSRQAPAPIAPPPIAPHPLGESYGQQYDPQKYEACRKKTPGNSACDVHVLKRVDNPELWPYPKVAPVKWPEAPKESVYRAGMSGVDYWRALCKAEGGEFVYKTVENVKGIYQIRPRNKELHHAMGDRYVMEDPYGYMDGELGRDLPFMFTGPRHSSRFATQHYNFLETAPIRFTIGAGEEQYYDPSLAVPQLSGTRFERFYEYDARDKRTMKMKYVSSLESRYGFTWRGIRRPNDREVGVAGGETIVVDLKTNEILAVRRGFTLAATSPDGRVSWFTGNTCPEYSKMEGMGRVRKRNKDVDFTLWFLTRVLVPANAAPEQN